MRNRLPTQILLRGYPTQDGLLPSALDRLRRSATLATLFTLACYHAAAEPRPSPAGYTRLEPLPAPKIVASAEPYPGNYDPGNLLDGNSHSEYSSNGKGTNTFVEFDFRTPTRVAAFRHLD